MNELTKVYCKGYLAGFQSGEETGKDSGWKSAVSAMTQLIKLVKGGCDTDEAIEKVGVDRKFAYGFLRGCDFQV